MFSSNQVDCFETVTQLPSLTIQDKGSFSIEPQNFIQDIQFYFHIGSISWSSVEEYDGFNVSITVQGHTDTQLLKLSVGTCWNKFAFILHFPVKIKREFRIKALKALTTVRSALSHFISILNAKTNESIHSHRGLPARLSVMPVIS